MSDQLMRSLVLSVLYRWVLCARAGTHGRQKRDNVNKIQFGSGMLVVLVAAGLLLTDALESGAALGLGFIGIVLISASGWNRKRT